MRYYNITSSPQELRQWFLDRGITFKTTETDYGIEVLITWHNDKICFTLSNMIDSPRFGTTRIQRDMHFIRSGTIVRFNVEDDDPILTEFALSFKTTQPNNFQTRLLDQM